MDFTFFFSGDVGKCLEVGWRTRYLVIKPTKITRGMSNSKVIIMPNHMP